MKAYLLEISFLAMIIANACPAIAQRFTSRPVQRPVKADTGFINSERAYLALKAGNLDEARKYLSLADASNPFAMFVRAALNGDATIAAGIYRVIVNEYPDKPIAREALLQLYKYHYAAGNYRLAHTDYLQLNKYPGMTQLVDPAGLRDSIQNQTSPISPLPQDAVTAPAPAPEESDNYSIQLGVFSTQENADRFVAQLKTNRIKAVVSTKESSGKVLYFVTTGNFSTREAADTFAADLKRRSIDCVVIKIGESRE
jgi:SPOR domain